VFLVNSRFPVLDVATVMSRHIVGRLIPKLERNFAEFLKYRYPKRLDILYQMTSVGL